RKLKGTALGYLNFYHKTGGKVSRAPVVEGLVLNRSVCCIFVTKCNKQKPLLDAVILSSIKINSSREQILALPIKK
uniref:Uncharacterized protein n=1 Tax=Monodon monoceros TaxID=40151 RepID=A0A8C6AQR4_MONMO